jgi:predicted Zn-dependent peptidase
MSDLHARRRLAAALAAAALAVPPVLAGCAVDGPAQERSALATAVAPSDRPRHPRELAFEEQPFEFPHSERVVLSNGMVLHLIEDPSLPLVDASAVFRGGSVFDPEGKEGLAGLACSLVRGGGTTSLPPDRLDHELDMIAGSVGVGADSESLSAGFSFLSKDLDRGLEIFADVLRNPAFDGQRFQITKAQAMQGLQRSLQSPGGVLARAFTSTVHGDHPYGNLTTPASIQAITVDDLRAFHARWFRPESFVLGIAGDFKRDALVAKLEKVFAGWEKSPEPLPKWPAPFERAYAGGHVVVPMPGVTQTNVRMGHWGPPQNSVDRVHFDVMNLILGGGGFWSRMTKVVRTKEGLAYSVGCGLSRASQGGVYSASVETKASTTYRAISLMKGLIAEIRETPVTAEDLELAKGSILNGFVRVVESPASLASQYASLEFREYPPDWLDRYRAIVRATTVEDCQRVAKEYLRPEGLTVVLVGDPAAFDAAPADLGAPETVKPR